MPIISWLVSRPFVVERHFVTLGRQRCSRDRRQRLVVVWQAFLLTRPTKPFCRPLFGRSLCDQPLSENMAPTMWFSQQLCLWCLFMLKVSQNVLPKLKCMMVRPCQSSTSSLSRCGSRSADVRPSTDNAFVCAVRQPTLVCHHSRSKAVDCFCWRLYERNVTT